MTAADWTRADQAELEALLSEFAARFAEHRERCERCRTPRCPTADEWIRHRKACPACVNGIRVGAGPWRVCPTYTERLEHIKTCPHCVGPCPSLVAAIDAVLAWREARRLRTRAQALRAEQNLIASRRLAA